MIARTHQQAKPKAQKARPAACVQVPSMARFVLKIAPSDNEVEAYDHLSKCPGLWEVVAESLPGFVDGRLPGDLGDTPGFLDSLDRGEAEDKSSLDQNLYTLKHRVQGAYFAVEKRALRRCSGPSLQPAVCESHHASGCPLLRSRHHHYHHQTCRQAVRPEDGDQVTQGLLILKKHAGCTADAVGFYCTVPAHWAPSQSPYHCAAVRACSER